MFISLCNFGKKILINKKDINKTMIHKKGNLHERDPRAVGSSPEVCEEERVCPTTGKVFPTRSDFSPFFYEFWGKTPKNKQTENARRNEYNYIFCILGIILSTLSGPTFTSEIDIKRVIEF